MTMVLRWTMEAAIAAAAVAITTAGSLYTTVYHAGAVTQQIVELQDKTAQTDTRVSKLDDQVDLIKQQNATTTQALSDIKDVVKDIQTQVRKPHGNHE